MDKLLTEKKLAMVLLRQRIRRDDENITEKGIMNRYRLQLVEMRNAFANLKKSYTAELSKMPTGNLWLDNRGDRKQYYLGRYKNGKRD